MLPKHILSRGLIRANRFYCLILTACFSLLWPIVNFAANPSGGGAPATTGANPSFPTTNGSFPVNVSGASAETFLINISQQLPNLMRMVTAIAYVLGMWMIIKAILELKRFGEQRTQMSSEHKMTGPIAILITGSLLLYLPSAVQLGMSTFWTNPNPYGYMQSQDQWSQFINVCFTVVQFVGVIAFIKGLVILSHVGSQGGQQGVVSKGLTHIIGGLFCINIYQFVQVILSTLGLAFTS